MSKFLYWCRCCFFFFYLKIQRKYLILKKYKFQCNLLMICRSVARKWWKEKKSKILHNAILLRLLSLFTVFGWFFFFRLVLISSFFFFHTNTTQQQQQYKRETYTKNDNDANQLNIHKKLFNLKNYSAIYFWQTINLFVILYFKMFDATYKNFNDCTQWVRTTKAKIYINRRCMCMTCRCNTSSSISLWPFTCFSLFLFFSTFSLRWVWEHTCLCYFLPLIFFFSFFLFLSFLVDSLTQMSNRCVGMWIDEWMHVFEQYFSSI